MIACVAAVVIVMAAVFLFWRSTQVEMPNVIGESAAQALVEICEVQGQTMGLFDGSEDWNGRFVDENGNVLNPSFSEAQNVYEVVSVSPAVGTLMGKDDNYSICIKKSAAAVKAEREEAASKLIKDWEERFGAGKGTYEVYDFNCALVSFTGDGIWKMEQQEQDTLDLFAEKQKCNVLLFVYDSDGYIIAAYNAFYSGSSDEDTASFVSLGVKKIADAKKVTDSEIEQFMAGMSRAFSNEGIESTKWGKDGDYLTFEVRLKGGLYNAVKGDKAKESELKELKEMLDIMANQIAYLMKSNFEFVIILDDFTMTAKAEYKGDFFTNNDEFNEWASKILA